MLKGCSDKFAVDEGPDFGKVVGLFCRFFATAEGDIFLVTVV